MAFGLILPAVPDHGTLPGLGDDDHTLYLLVDGTRALGGNWSLGGFNLTSAGNITGSDVDFDAGTGDWTTTGLVGIGGPVVSNERLKLLMAATDTVGINVDGTTNPFVYALDALLNPVNSFKRTVNDDGGAIESPTNSFFNAFTTNWAADLEGTGLSWGGKTFDNMTGELFVTSDLSTDGSLGAGSTLRTVTFNAAKFTTQISGTLTTNSTGTRLWNPQFIAFNADTNFIPTAITSTNGNALYQAIGLKGMGRSGMLPANTHTADTQTMEFIGLLAEAEGQTNPGNLPTTSFGAKLSATGSDVNWGLYVEAGKSILLDALYFTQTDGAERIDSDTDGTLDLYAGTSVDVHDKFITTEGRIFNMTRIDDGDSPYTVLVTDHKIVCDTDAGTITVNLPAGVNGTQYKITNTGSSGNSVTITPNGAELFLGANTNFNVLDGGSEQMEYETTEGWW